ncbi:MAG: terminase family protein [bacterium]
MSSFNYAPHPAQCLIHQARDKRFRTVCTGRRFGKTLCLAAELLDRGGSEKAGEYGWVAPTYNVAERGIEAIRLIADGAIEVSGRAPSRVEFRTKLGTSRIWFLSADNPDNIRGFGFQGIVIDEAAAIPVSVWHYVLRPTIAQTLGWAVFVSTPKGRNWFYDLYTRGLDPGEKDYASFSFPSKASPYFPAKEWEEAKRTLPADVFRQEYEAEFLEDSAGVFRNIDGCLFDPAALSMEQRSPSRNVIIGCDVAKHTDWTVLIAMDAETGRCFDMERFNHLDWPIQKERILAFAFKHRGRIVLDATGVGDPIYDDLKRVWPDIEGFKFTSSSKTALVQRLIVAVEQRRVSWPGTGRESSSQNPESRIGTC